MGQRAAETSAAAQARLIDAAIQQVLDLPSGPAAAGAALPIDPGTFPGYQIVEQIHRGGQGVVFKALQESTRRHVAIKVLRDASLASPGELLRFEQEVRVLGGLRHPNIVAIFDSHTEGGRCWFVMDYIDGEALDAYVRTRELAIPEVLRLFVKICDAVNAAHLRGVIHRDLKPGNIRVDARGEPYVLDFGLSKLADGGDRSSMTLTGQFVGTAPWASPEQADGRSAATDMRTDVYALGVLAYQMLTGRFPYRVEGTPRDVLEQVLHADPVPPRRHRPEIPADVETVVLKCLQKDPERRYQTAGDLGRDLNRCLRGEPIEARRDSLAYMVRKQLARHKTAAGVAIAFVLVLAVGFVTSLTFWRLSEHARSAAEHQRRVAQRSAEEALEQARRAEAEGARARAVAQFLTDMFTTASPIQGAGREARVVDALDTAKRRIERGDLARQPEERATVHRAIGTTYAALGLYSEAIEQLEAALALRRELHGPAHDETQRSAGELAIVLRALDRLDEAEALLREALDAPVDEPDPAVLATLLNALAGTLSDRGRQDEAEPLYRRALELRREVHGESNRDVLTTVNDLALSLKSRGDVAGARALLEEAVERGANDPNVPQTTAATLASNLASILIEQGEFDGAEPLLRRALRTFEAAYGPGHSQVAHALGSLAALYQAQQRYDDALPLHERALAIHRATVGETHSNVATSLNNLAVVHFALGQYEQAAAALRDALDTFIALYGEDHPGVLTIRGNLAAILRQGGQPEEAAALLRQVLAGLELRHGDVSLPTAQARNNLGMTLLDLDQLDEAEALLRRALEDRRVLLSDQHPDVANSMENLGGVLHRRGQYEEAEKLLRGAYEIIVARDLKGDLCHAAMNLADVLVDQDRAAEAEPVYRQALEAGVAALPPAHWQLAAVRCRLGQCLAKLDRNDEAEALLLDGYTGLEKALGPQHDRTQRAVQALVALYEQAADREQADAWRARLTTAAATGAGPARE